MTGGTWYNTYICKKLYENCLRDILEIQELTDIISYVLLMQMKKSINNLSVISVAVGVVHLQQFQQ